ncbi:hypothetical protein OH720_11430 [Pseudomonas sp. WJP1]|nr:hypothetical protein [Pseudomonas sp. WJP1]WCM53587.1 hypothetical protein OH720_11430 [Pseudomonas sp. WJP1]
MYAVNKIRIGCQDAFAGKSDRRTAGSYSKGENLGGRDRYRMHRLIAWIR